MIENAKRDYLLETAETLANLVTSSKTYWSLINTLLNKAKLPTIPPLYEDGLFITDLKRNHRYSMTILYFNVRQQIQEVSLFNLKPKGIRFS